jgi:uncharacterized membrane protein
VGGGECIFGEGGSEQVKSSRWQLERMPRTRAVARAAASSTHVHSRARIARAKRAENVYREAAAEGAKGAKQVVAEQPRAAPRSAAADKKEIGKRDAAASWGSGSSGSSFYDLGSLTPSRPTSRPSDLGAPAAASSSSRPHDAALIILDATHITRVNPP